jgi:hypothetical protein
MVVDTSVRPWRTFETVGMLVPTRRATSASVTVVGASDIAATIARFAQTLIPMIQSARGAVSA